MSNNGEYQIKMHDIISENNPSFLQRNKRNQFKIAFFWVGCCMGIKEYTQFVHFASHEGDWTFS
ncbi:hypothetical protein C0081_10110 [Cohaesibacter celericrescens]|uniref:Uncharacterized protein n=1 Tax=Cohaesibacter celericrescens TaxID=2067669 RepID=A0A2N5XT13_9HYPH|nr:hypothetical protein C0081_10110 [Cohaesibacter celericrescens]